MVKFASGVELPNDSLPITLSYAVILTECILTFILAGVSSSVISATLHCTRDLSYVQYASLIICELVLIAAIVASYLATRKYWN